MQVVQSSIMSRLCKNPRFISLLLYADVLHLILWSFYIFLEVFEFLRPFIHGRKDQNKSCTTHHGKSLLFPCLRSTCNFFWLFFWAGYCCFTTKQRARIMVGLEHPTIRLRGGNEITSLPLPNFTTAPNSTKKKNSRQK